MRRKLLLWLLDGLDDDMVDGLEKRIRVVGMRRAARVAKLWAQK